MSFCNSFIAISNEWRPGIALGVTQRQPAIQTISRDMLNHELPSLSPVSILQKLFKVR